MPNLFCPTVKLRGRRWPNNKKTTKNGESLNGEKRNEPSITFRESQDSSIELTDDDIVIIATKNSRKQISGLTLELIMQDNHQCLVVQNIMEGSLFAKTSLTPDMEIRVINGIDCSKLKFTTEAYDIMKQAKRTVTIVARERNLREKDNPLSPIQPLRPIRRSSPEGAAAHMWLEMVDYHVSRKDTPQFLSSRPPKEEFVVSPRPRKEEVQDEHVEAPPTPCFKKTSRPKALPSNLEVDYTTTSNGNNKRSSSHSAISEITLNPSEHQATMIQPADIVITRRPAKKKKKSSIKSVLAALYPDYDSDSDKNDGDGSAVENKSSTTISHCSTQDVSLTPTSSFLREQQEESSPSSRPSLHGVDVVVVSPPPLDNDDDEDNNTNSSSEGSFRAGPMESNSLYPPSIPHRV